MNLNGKQVDLLALQAELVDAGLVIPALTQQGDELLTYDAQGTIVDLSPAAEPVVAAHQPTAITQAQQLKQQILTQANSAVGVALNDLTAGQRNALTAVLLWRAGGVTPQMTVRPLADWVR